MSKILQIFGKQKKEKIYKSNFNIKLGKNYKSN